MRSLLLVLCAITLAISALIGRIPETLTIQTEKTDENYLISREINRQNNPNYSFNIAPMSIMHSWYNYFPGNYHSIPIRVQPSPAGMHPGGGIYIAFQATPAGGGTRRVYYVYIQDGSITSGPGLIDGNATLAEGFPGIDIDWETGDPFVSWHATNPNNPNFYYCPLTFDAYHMLGIPGFWETPYGVILNPYDVGPEQAQEFIWPLVFIGPSPNPDQRRIYITANNNILNASGYPCENVLLAFADFSEPSDLESYDPDQWTYTTIPQMDQWRQENIRPFFAPIVSKNSGRIALFGHTEQCGPVDPYHTNNFLFLLENDSYGEGDWTLFTGTSSIQVDNPDGYFTGYGNQPFQDMRYIIYRNRHNTVIDREGNFHFVGFYTLFAEDWTWFPSMSTEKHVKFLRNTEEFIVTDLYPRNEDGTFYLPWNIPPEYDDYGFLILNQSWPCWWHQSGDIFFENYHRIIQDENRLIALFQSSELQMFWPFDMIPKTHIMISNDYGVNWSDPIILDSENTPELANMIPTYWYLADHMEHLYDNWYRIHLMFLDKDAYTIIDPGYGGNIMYTSLDIDFTPTSVDEGHIVVVPEKMLLQNYPNPFNPETIIEFYLPAEMKITLEIFNIKGQLIKTLVDGYQPAGNNFVVWNCRDHNNHEVSSGIYFYKLTTDTHIETRKMLLLK
ncbi:MAG: T9SS type A sorting domain-containing protein [Candidatus Cloacimonetes bacterium]|nr:T9SS type A sorting domain-containing protein [Candidatus Cloacimonadota bacterium]